MMLDRSNAHSRAGDQVWIILTSDGRHALLGRHSEPTEEELQAAGDAMTTQGISAWLAVREGDYYHPNARVSVTKVRALTRAEGDWSSAVEAFERFRRNNLESACG